MNKLKNAEKKLIRASGQIELAIYELKMAGEFDIIGNLDSHKTDIDKAASMIKAKLEESDSKR